MDDSEPIYLATAELLDWQKGDTDEIYAFKVVRAARYDAVVALLAEAKRMAEFGDINADMADDGIGWKAWYIQVSRVLLPLPAPDVERCFCDAFNHAVNEEMIFWDTATEEESAAWMMDTQLCAGGDALTINFCPFCGKLPPLLPHV